MSLQPKLAHNWFSCFCTAYSCAQDTDRQTDRTCYVCHQ